MFASGKNATASANSEPRARRGEAEPGAGGGEPERPAERGRTGARRDPAGSHAGEGAGQHAARAATALARTRPALVGFEPPFLRRRFRERAELLGEALGRGPALRVDEERARDRSSTCCGRSGRSDSSGGAPSWIRREVSTVSPPQNGWRRRAPPRAARRRPRRRPRSSRCGRAVVRGRCRRACRGCRRARSACRTPPSAPGRSRAAGRRCSPTRRAGRSTA